MKTTKLPMKVTIKITNKKVACTANDGKVGTEQSTLEFFVVLENILRSLPFRSSSLISLLNMAVVSYRKSTVLVCQHDSDVRQVGMVCPN